MDALHIKIKHIKTKTAALTLCSISGHQNCIFSPIHMAFLITISHFKQAN